MSNDRTVLFVGSKRIGLEALKALSRSVGGRVKAVVTADDAADERSILPQFQSHCAAAKLPLSVLHKSSDLKAVVAAQRPHVVVVVGWYWILPPELLAMAPGGFVGVHGSLLPRYRGQAPLVWAILRGETQAGATMFYFDDGMDTGDIVDQRTVPIGPEDSIAEVLAAVQEQTIDMVATHAQGLLEGTAPRRRQNALEATYGSLRRPEDGRIDWSASALEVHNFIRAQSRPYPGAFTTLGDGRELRIWRASVFPMPYYGIAGLVAQPFDGGIVVLCGQGAIIVRDCQTADGQSGPGDLLKWGARLGGSAPA
ncbi:MAG: methionyl-tRNA formyltransferase [Planctomycetaceae bacterium]|nr:methionyl-tRNA formyltransferase [Planctomycetaceae bacterium]